MRFTVEPEIFTLFPRMKIVVAAAAGLKCPSPATEAAIAAELAAAWEAAGREVALHGNAQSHPRIKPWGERMRGAGAPRKEFPCSIEALARRAGKGGPPVRVNPPVDFYNAVSLRRLVPAGGFDIAGLERGLLLRLSRPGDTFTALDRDEAVAVPAGEVSYADGPVILTRHFVWKQSRQAILTPASRDILFLSEILGELEPGLAEAVAEDFRSGLARHFGIDATTAILDEQRPSFEI